MKKDLPRLTLTPIEPTQQAQAGTEPARRNPPLPRYDGPPAYLRGAGRTVPHGAPGVLAGKQPEPQPEDPQAQWEQAVAQQAQQTPEPPSGAKRDVYDAAQAFWELMRGAKRRPKASEPPMDGDQAALGTEPIAQGAWTQEHPRRFFRRDASLGQRQGVAALAQQAWQSKKRARSGAARHMRPQRTEKQAGAPFLTTLQGQISVCVGVILLALAVKAVDSPAAQSVSATVSDAITMEMDVDQDVGSCALCRTCSRILWRSGFPKARRNRSRRRLTGAWIIAFPSSIPASASAPRGRRSTPAKRAGFPTLRATSWAITA